MSRVLLGLTALGLVACADTVDVSRLPSIEGYASWPSYGHHGAIPGHGESYRTIFVNPVGRGYPGHGRYPLGTVLVKEIADDVTMTQGGQVIHVAGDLRYLGVMRKIGDDSGEETHNGWLFTYIGSRGGEESVGQGCWSTCHRAAPLDGTWGRYGE